MVPEPHWTTYFTLITPFAAACAAYVAYRFGAIQASIAEQQAQTARAAALTAQNKLKLELFDRRFAIYTTVRAYIDRIVVVRGFDPDEDAEFLRAIAPMRWLFDQPVVDYVLGDLRKKIRELISITAELEGQEAGPARSIYLVNQSTMLFALSQEHESVDRVFGPYLKLTHSAAPSEKPGVASGSLRG